VTSTFNLHPSKDFPMLLPPPVQFRKRRPQRSPAIQAALTLVKATYSPTPSPVLTLVFDRAVNIEKFSGGSIELDDAANTGKLCVGGSATLSDPETLSIALQEVTTITGSGVHLTASRDSGIIAANDGGSWSGCTNLPIPFST
jgi:hypothetical protein